MCTNHRGVCSLNGTVFTAPAKGSVITASQINTLKDAIKAEISRWAIHRLYPSTDDNAYFGYLSMDAGVGQFALSGFSGAIQTMDNIDEAMRYLGGDGFPANETGSNDSNYPAGATITMYPDLEDPNFVKDYGFPQGGNISYDKYAELIANYDLLRQDCICNTDCSCNAVCSCNGNCGCNYSDERLKQEIVYC